MSILANDTSSRCIGGISAMIILDLASSNINDTGAEEVFHNIVNQRTLPSSCVDIMSHFLLMICFQVSIPRKPWIILSKSNLSFKEPQTTIDRFPLD